MSVFTALPDLAEQLLDHRITSALLSLPWRDYTTGSRAVFVNMDLGVTVSLTYRETTRRRSPREPRWSVWHSHLDSPADAMDGETLWDMLDAIETVSAPTVAPRS